MAIVKSIDEFYEVLKNKTEVEDNLIYRGVRNENFKLIPSIGRLKRKGSQLNTEDEIRILNIFKHRAYPFIKDYKDDELEILSIGQHHGLPTRLLDWTKNPLIAAYFSVEEEFTEYDKETTEYSCIYIYKAKKLVRLNKTFDPFKIDTVERYVPKHWDERIISQGGLFTVHNNPYESWEPEGLSKILIHQSVREAIKKTLNRFGVHPGSVYPDIDGIAKHIKWLRSDEY